MSDSVIHAQFGDAAHHPHGGEGSALSRALEALLFTARSPISEAELAQRLQVTELELSGLLSGLQALYQSRGVVLERQGEHWAFRTASDVADYLASEREVEKKLSRAAIETLSIIAYHQPVTRAEIEEIRGVAVSKGTLDLLLEMEWIQPAGRRETLGRPLQWGTSSYFLDHFNLTSIGDLPGLEELRAAGLLSKRSTLNSETLGKMGEEIEEDGVLDSQESEGADMFDAQHGEADDEADREGVAHADPAPGQAGGHTSDQAVDHASDTLAASGSQTGPEADENQHA